MRDEEPWRRRCKGRTSGSCCPARFEKEKGLGKCAVQRYGDRRGEGEDEALLRWRVKGGEDEAPERKGRWLFII
jgi:hypothetical protein